MTLGDSTIREVTQTLRAAVADPEVLEQVLRGNLTASAENSGFGPAGVFVVPEPLQEPVADESEASGADADGADRVGADRDDADDSDHTASDEAERRRRDLEALSTAGIPVYSQTGRGGGWRLVGGARTDLTGMSAGEARALTCR